MSEVKPEPTPETHRELFLGLGIALVVACGLSLLAFHPAPDFPREELLLTAQPPNLDEWRPKQ